MWCTCAERAVGQDADMTYPARLLTDGEWVAYDLRPHWRMLLRPAAVLLALVFLVSYASAAVSPSWQWLRPALQLAGLLVLVRWVVVPVLRWATTEYVITSQRVIVRRGVLARQGREMPLSRVTDVHFRYGVVDRILRCGTLVVESAGESGQLVIAGIPDVELVQREVFRLGQEDARRRRPGPAGGISA
jgi:uncharacterized membrane protein YdbT with pleckstrin-like domain